ncbi:toxin-antitoxin system, toxin component [Streptomyces dysideae]|uniref:Toxin-antitoxin system, toxin component n=1 Tax=Streptomyces dysideae TaxID=909626 RepID=A0A101UXS6_9ACTN|nr:toxin-antitoxin system, toxin component [Streptomyces dysideae]
MTWQKSSYCAQGEACVHISAASQAIHLTESADPTQAVLTTSPTAFGALLDTLKSPNTP